MLYELKIGIITFFIADLRERDDKMGESRNSSIDASSSRSSSLDDSFDEEAVAHHQLFLLYEKNHSLHEPWFNLFSLAYGVLILLTFLGNSLVVLAVARKKAMWSARNIFILNLALSGLSKCVCPSPSTSSRFGGLKNRRVFETLRLWSDWVGHSGNRIWLRRKKRYSLGPSCVLGEAVLCLVHISFSCPALYTLARYSRRWIKYIAHGKMYPSCTAIHAVLHKILFLDNMDTHRNVNHLHANMLMPENMHRRLFTV